jgi:hypothetical protein
MWFCGLDLYLVFDRSFKIQGPAPIGNGEAIHETFLLYISAFNLEFSSSKSAQLIHRGQEWDESEKGYQYRVAEEIRRKPEMVARANNLKRLTQEYQKEIAPLENALSSSVTHHLRNSRDFQLSTTDLLKPENDSLLFQLTKGTFDRIDEYKDSKKTVRLYIKNNRIVGVQVDRDGQMSTKSTFVLNRGPERRRNNLHSQDCKVSGILHQDRSKLDHLFVTLAVCSGISDLRSGDSHIITSDERKMLRDLGGDIPVRTTLKKLRDECEEDKKFFYFELRKNAVQFKDWDLQNLNSPAGKN